MSSEHELHDLDVEDKDGAAFVDNVKHTAIHLESGQQVQNGASAVVFTGRQFGTAQAFDESGRHVLNPQPSDSPNDPLNWSKAYKNYLAAISSAAVLTCNISGAGPSIAIIEQVIEWFGVTGINSYNINRTAYLFSLAALMNGVGLFVWVPAATKFGRRPVYIVAFAIYLATLFWCAFAKSYGSELAARLILGAAAGAGECLGALTVTDIFFVHERGLYMAYYNVFLGCGAAVGLIIDGVVTQHLTWRHIYYVHAAIVALLLILVIFTFPETAFNRNTLILNGHAGRQTETSLTSSEDVEGRGNSPRVDGAAQKKGKFGLMPLYSGTYTEESFWRMFLRPWGVVFLPAVMFSVIVFAATIGFLVAVTSNVAPAFKGIGFSTQQVGFLFFGAIIGSLVGIPAGGWLGDFMADYGAKRNNGVREPEHRLPALVLPIITGPLSLILYGLCIQNKTHWMVGCLGISLVNFNVCAATNIAMVYAIDCYKPIADEVVTATLAFKAILGFVLGFYTNAWVGAEGYLPAYGEMAAIEGGLLLFAVPVYFYGKRLRHASAKWKFLQWALVWNDDRDDLKIE